MRTSETCNGTPELAICLNIACVKSISKARISRTVRVGNDEYLKYKSQQNKNVRIIVPARREEILDVVALVALQEPHHRVEPYDARLKNERFNRRSFEHPPFNKNDF